MDFSHMSCFSNSLLVLSVLSLTVQGIRLDLGTANQTLNIGEELVQHNDSLQEISNDDLGPLFSNETVSDSFNQTTDETTQVLHETPTEPTSAVKQAKPNPYAIINKGTVSKKQYEVVNIVVNVALSPVICVTGLVMNAIGAFILLQRQFRRSTYTYLCVLAFSDMGLLTCRLIRAIPKIAILQDDILANLIDMKTFPSINIFAMSTFTRISELIICTLAIERLIAVYKPLKVKNLFLSRHALGVSIGVSVFCVLFHVHYLFVYYPKPFFNQSRNTTMYTLGQYPWFVESGIKPVYDIVYEIIFLYVPVLLLVACNSSILALVRFNNQKRLIIAANNAADNKMNREQSRITWTLLIISGTFTIVLLPLVILTLVQKFSTEVKVYGREHYLMYTFIDVLSLGWSINSANNFIIYVYTSQQFKHVLMGMFCKWRRTNSVVKDSTATRSISTIKVVDAGIQTFGN